MEKAEETVTATGEFLAIPTQVSCIYCGNSTPVMLSNMMPAQLIRCLHCQSIMEVELHPIKYDVRKI